MCFEDPYLFYRRSEKYLGQNRKAFLQLQRGFPESDNMTLSN
jgi:hypothetical protein